MKEARKYLCIKIANQPPLIKDGVVSTMKPPSNILSMPIYRIIVFLILSTYKGIRKRFKYKEFGDFYVNVVLFCSIFPNVDWFYL